MFYDRFIKLCEDSNIKPTPLLRKLGLNGATLNSAVLIKIADYFDCSTDYLLGRTDNPDSHKK